MIHIFFHDDDGRTWLVNTIMDHSKAKFFGGIVLQEYNKAQQKLIGEIHNIFPGTELGRTEGPQIYKHNGYYYLLTAEGGTSYEHAMTMARSKSLTGPYEVDPLNLFISAAKNPELYLQKTGHGALVQTQDGDWYAVFFASRPLTTRGRCIAGRESAIERVVWSEDGWLRLACDGNEPRREVGAPNLPDFPFEPEPERIEFESPNININFQALRVSMTPDWVNQTDRPGYLRLYGRESLNSTFRQSLIARRVQAHHIQAETCLEFEPVTFQQLAGLICYYNTYHYLYVFGNDDDTKKYLVQLGINSFRVIWPAAQLLKVLRPRSKPGTNLCSAILGIITNDKYNVSEPNGEPIDLTGVERIYLKVDYDGADLQFTYPIEENRWQKIGPVLDGSILSDEYVEDAAVRYRPCFTGAFVVCAARIYPVATYMRTLIGLNTEKSTEQPTH